ncbi:UDP-glycosyltransferase 87A1 [Quercus suber]|uniref:UDP-glycosyltransferase 87A1 n=1 Tax=Quercus suber TaxID=58331 RepID=UPI000CE1705B|nr:UDP-glycosyltransferase 87A1-like [Quercus suber]POF22745.1 isoform 2 of udp-glycosyltransferase 87a2 [Quercus suber]
MDSTGAEPTTVFHVVAMPFPCQGHINALMSLCKLLSSRKHNLLITFVVTEEWLHCIGSEPKPDNIHFASIPTVIERANTVDFGGFNEVVKTKMEAPFEQLLDRLEPPVARIIADFELQWSFGVGIRRNIPLASLWTMSASFFSSLHHYHVFAQAQPQLLPLHLIDQGEEHVDNILGISSNHLEDLRTVFHENDPRGMEMVMECISKGSKAQYLLINSVYELEPQAFDTMKAIFHFPVYPIGPAIRYMELEHSSFITTTSDNNPDYLKWLDSQSAGSILYISLGSFFVLTDTQMDEFAAALRNSGVRFLWVARGEASRLKESCGDTGLVVPWCDQLRVLCHPSIGGFWSHCGWNSTQEAVYAGIPMLTFPLFLDQVPNSRQIVEDWKIGWRVKRAQVGSEILVTKEDILELVQRFMELESCERKKTWKRARELKNMCHQAITEGGSSHSHLDAFVSDFLEVKNH